MAKAIIFGNDQRFLAWTWTHGWPRRTLHWHWHENEYYKRIWHICVVALGYSLEFRFSWHSEVRRWIPMSASEEICAYCGGFLSRPVPPTCDGDVNPMRCHYRANYCSTCGEMRYHWGGCADQNALLDYPYGKHPIPYPPKEK